MMKRLISGIIFAVFLFPSALFSQEPANGALGIVSVPLANVRKEPIPKSSIVTQLLMGDEVKILEKQDYRYRVSISAQGNREGWIHQEAVLLPKEKGRSYNKTDRQWIVIFAPKTPALILDKTGNHNVSLYAGTRLHLLESVPEGHKVQFPDRTVAIINSDDARPVRPRNPVMDDSIAVEIAKTARRFYGVRHLAGGLSAQGMDTAGLIYITYRIHGVNIDMDRTGLTSQAIRVAKKDLQPGDIIVFYGEGLGLYLDTGRFLHSVRKQSVQLGGIYDRRYANSLQYGLRIVGSDPLLRKLPAYMTADEILLTQVYASELPLGRRIAYWAGRFIGTPYDPDPLGLYVRTNRIVADEKADCMYHTFRSVELAMSETPGQAIDKALDLRFITKGEVTDGLVRNYDDRYQYGEDMVMSGKWGRNITADLGATKKIIGSRRRDEVEILPKAALMGRAIQRQLRDGDIIYWVKDPKKRVVEEIVAHLSIVRIRNNKPYLVHASGSKDSATKPGVGVVKEVPFLDYVRDMKFIGAFVTRFEE